MIGVWIILGIVYLILALFFYIHIKLDAVNITFRNYELNKTQKILLLVTPLTILVTLAMILTVIYLKIENKIVKIRARIVRGRVVSQTDPYGRTGQNERKNC